MGVFLYLTTEFLIQLQLDLLEWKLETLDTNFVLQIKITLEQQQKMKSIFLQSIVKTN